MVIELKNGETIVGQLTNVDNWMNLTLANVTHTSASDAVKLPEIYVRGNFIKYIKLQDDVIDKVKQSNAQQQSQGQNKDFRRRQGGGRRDGEKRFHSGNNPRRGDGRDSYHNNGANRRPYNSSNHNRNNDTGSSNNKAMGGFVRHHNPGTQT